ncbi:MAG: hypothetical protein M0R80_26350 [Proteobacteria bacterium]|nr:hypothetical protein [Pseudomonadota bacterium]
MTRSWGIVAAACVAAACSGGDTLIIAQPANGTPPATVEPGAVGEQASGDRTAPDAGGPVAASPSATASSEPAPPPASPAARTIRFAWCPSPRAAASYAMEEPEDQHRIVLTPGVIPGGRFPVVIGFHGQPKRGKPPRDYWFPGFVADRVTALVAERAIRPVVLVLPVFRYEGGNWPWFDPARFEKEVVARLASEGIEAGDVYAFGHSGAAGCGGGGLNFAHLMKPAAVGFFDTCLGAGWREALGALRAARIPTLDVRSVETAGFSPRQRPEYQAEFDFGRAYAPEGLEKVACEGSHPGERLRDQPFRCAATGDGVVRAFIVDTGEGEQAHKDVVGPAIDFFLAEVAKLRP